MSLLGSQSTGLGSVPTAAGGTGAGAGGGGGTIREITSADGSVVVTNPTGPVTDLSVPGAEGAGWGVELSYGDGNGSTDDDLPVSPESETTFWIGEGMDADHAGPLGGGQVREWPTHQWLAALRLVATIDYAQFFGAEWGGSRLVVTVDGVETGIEIAYADVVVENDYQTVAAAIAVAPGSKIGLKLVTIALGDGSKLRGHFRLIGEVSVAPEGPYVGATLTRRHETAEGFTIETDPDTDDLLVWPNEGSVGVSHDWVPIEDVPAPTVVTEDGQRIVRLDTICGAIQRTVPGSGEFAPPVGVQFAPFWCLDLLRVGAGGAGTRWARTYAPNGGAPGLSFDLDIPITPTFQLVWQFLGGNNIQTVPNLDGSILGEWALLEWGFDGTDFRFFLNGAEVALTQTNPSIDNAAADQTSSYIGSRGLSDTIHIDYAAQFTYSEWPTTAQRAQTRAYLATAYPGIFP
jgi:hypothetical protein